MNEFAKTKEIVNNFTKQNLWQVGIFFYIQQWFSQYGSRQPRNSSVHKFEIGTLRDWQTMLARIAFFYFLKLFCRVPVLGKLSVLNPGVSI